MFWLSKTSNKISSLMTRLAMNPYLGWTYKLPANLNKLNIYRPLRVLLLSKEVRLVN